MSTHQSQVTGGNGGDDSAGEEEFTSTQLSINTTGTDELLDEIASIPPAPMNCSMRSMAC